MTELEGFTIYPSFGRTAYDGIGLSVQVLDRHDIFRVVGQWRTEDCKPGWTRARRREWIRYRAARVAAVLNGEPSP